MIGQENSCSFIACDKKPTKVNADYYKGFYIFIELCDEHNKQWDKIRDMEIRKKTMELR